MVSSKADMMEMLRASLRNRTGSAWFPLGGSADAGDARLNALLASEAARWRELTLYEHMVDPGSTVVAGVDEAGRGPLAGPVVAAAVILPVGRALPGVDDSKKLTAPERERLFAELADSADWATGIVGPAEIDAVNILQATRQAMKTAVAGLRTQPAWLLLDAMTLPEFAIPQKGIIRGDSLSASIAAASIVAKVTRDRLMLHYDRIYPHYGFGQHKGYATREHLAALACYGPCPIHRRSFQYTLSDAKEAQ